MQPTNSLDSIVKTKSSDFLVKQPKVANTSAGISTEAEIKNLNSSQSIKNTQSSNQKPADGINPKTSAHIIDLKSSTHDTEANLQNNQLSNNQADEGFALENQESSRNTVNDHPVQHSADGGSTESRSDNVRKKGGKLKWLLIILAVVVLLVAAAVGGIYLAGMGISSSSDSNGSSSTHSSHNM